MDTIWIVIGCVSIFIIIWSLGSIIQNTRVSPEKKNDFFTNDENKEKAPLKHNFEYNISNDDEYDDFDEIDKYDAYGNLIDENECDEFGFEIEYDDDVYDEFGELLDEDDYD